MAVGLHLRPGIQDSRTASPFAHLEEFDVPDQFRRNHEDELRREGRRGWSDRAGEEVRSWFGDDDARTRRGNDERDDRYPYGGDRDRGWRDQGDGSYERGAERWRGTDRGSEHRQMGGRDYERERYGSHAWPADRADDRGWSGGAGGDWGASEGRREWPEREHQWDEQRMGRRPEGGGYRGDRHRGGQGRGFGPGSFGPSGSQGTSLGGRWQSGAREFEDYTGRGPKDYRRSDERIREEVSDRLTDDYSVDASDITVQVKDGEVTLSGSVTTREQKRRAEDLAESISGVREVTNSLRVQRGGATQPGLSGGTATSAESTSPGSEAMTAGDRQQPAAGARRSGSTTS
jgi:hypothetical protein